jgi:zinc D-Ala-D-Ala dipeptidase
MISIRLTFYPMHAPLTLRSPIRCEDIASAADFVALRDVDDIALDLRYATTQNFVGRDLYSPLDCAWLHHEAAHALRRSVAWLSKVHPQYQLCVFDALRPQRVQEALWKSLEGTALHLYLAPPELGSLHSFGMAIDVTLRDRGTNAECDMGTPFDDMTPLAHPEFESQHRQSGALSIEQLDRRLRLRAAMLAGGWRGIETEWWHFDYGDRTQIRAYYPRVL